MVIVDLETWRLCSSKLYLVVENNQLNRPNITWSMSKKVIALASVLCFALCFLLIMVLIIEHEISPVCISQQYLVIEKNKQLNWTNITQAMLNRVVALPSVICCVVICLCWYISSCWCATDLTFYQQCNLLTIDFYRQSEL